MEMWGERMASQDEEFPLVWILSTLHLFFIIIMVSYHEDRSDEVRWNDGNHLQNYKAS
jgi:hypothetical protein